MINEILKHFPSKDTPRDSQVKLLLQIEAALEKGKKFIIIQAPTGAGKSHISATLASYTSSPSPAYVNLVESNKMFDKVMGGYTYADEMNSLPSFGCMVLTVTKALQNQYGKLFSDACLLKGKQNYICAVDNDFDCDLAPCLLTPGVLATCQSNQTCPFIEARKKALINRFGVLNYSAYLTMPDHVKRREIVVCDEASELEDELVSFYSCNVNYEDTYCAEIGIEKLLIPDSGNTFRWLCDTSEKIRQWCKDNESILVKTKNKRKTMSLMIKYRTLKMLMEKLSIVAQNWYKAEYITECTADQVTFTPLYVNVLAQDFYKLADTVILLSGTVIDHSTFARTLGITDYEYIEAESDFDPKKSPIYFSNEPKMNFKNMESVLPGLISTAVKLCDHHKTDKGIIHTHTFKITDSLKKATKGQSRFLFREAGATNEQILTEHFMREDATVLISPSLGFGTDLRDDFGRFSIVMKAPFLPLGSERIKKLAERDRKWYEMKALVNLVQMCGRTTRSKEDSSVTYVLDGTATALVRRCHSLLPKWFIDRVQ